MTDKITKWAIAVFIAANGIERVEDCLIAFGSGRAVWGVVYALSAGGAVYFVSVVIRRL